MRRPPTATKDVAKAPERACPIPARDAGLISASWRFETFAPVLASWASVPDEADVLHPDLLLHQEGRLEVYYSPFDSVNPAARVVIVGITPGRHQMYLALQAARDGILAGLPTDVILRRVSAAAAFAGSMRSNLVSMLDGIGIAAALGIATTATLFRDHQHLLNSTSASLYCVVRDGQNYSGSGPTISRSPILRAFATEVLTRVLVATPEALIVPLGRYAAEGVSLAAATGQVDPDRCLSSFPHPSGGNGHRVRLFTEHREGLTRRVSDWFSS